MRLLNIVNRLIERQQCSLFIFIWNNFIPNQLWTLTVCIEYMLISCLLTCDLFWSVELAIELFYIYTHMPIYIHLDYLHSNDTFSLIQTTFSSVGSFRIRNYSEAFPWVFLADRLHNVTGHLNTFRCVAVICKQLKVAEEASANCKSVLLLFLPKMTVRLPDSSSSVNNNCFMTGAELNWASKPFQTVLLH